MEAFFESYWGGILTGALVPIILGLFGNHAYHWLFRNPSIYANVRIRSMSSYPPHENLREYAYRIIITIENHSSNDAYNFMINDFKPSEERIKKLIPKSKNGGLITKTQSKVFEYDFNITLPIEKRNAGHTASERLKDFNKEIKFNISYKNESRRKFKRSKKVAMEIVEDNFIVL